MLSPELFEGLGRAPRILFLGAHCDDIEIGCGGTVLELLKAHPAAEITWIVFSSSAVREKEAREAARGFLGDGTDARIETLSFRNSFFPQQANEIKEFFETLKPQTDPDAIFTHHRGDLHQDHRTIGDLTWNTFRNHLILEYEIPKYDGGLGSPNAFIPIKRTTLDKKVRVILKEFTSQLDKHWFTEETFTALPRIRGIECNASEGFAEGYYCSKLTLQP